MINMGETKRSSAAYLDNRLFSLFGSCCEYFVIADSDSQRKVRLDFTRINYS